jgi:two-component sensor histidine kinase
MVVHELATNSVKHGALSASAGTLDVSGRTEDGEVHITWAETGGPELSHEPQMTGFGSRMIQRTVASQLAGSLSYDWQPSGLVATLIMLKDRMGR